MIEGDIEERMAGFAPSQRTGPSALASEIMSRQVDGPSMEPTVLAPSPLAREIMSRGNDSLMASLMGAVDVNPDEAARASALGAQVGVGQDIALRNMREVEHGAKMLELQGMQLRQRDPVLAEFMSDQAFARMAYDDVKTLYRIPEFFRPVIIEAAEIIPPGGLARVLERGYRRGTIQAERGQRYTSVMLERAGISAAAGEGEEERARQLTEQLRGMPQGGVFATTAEMVAQNVAQLRTIGTATAAGAAIGSAFPGPGTVAGGGIGMTAGIFIGTAEMEAGNIYGDLIEQGVSHEAAMPASIAAGALNGVIEVVGFKIASKPFRTLATKVFREEMTKALAQPTMRAALTRAGKAYATQVLSEGGEELGQELTAVTAEELAKAADGIDSETSLRSAAGRIIEAFAYGTMGSLLLGGIGPGANLAFDLRRAQATDRQQKLFQDLSENRAESRLAQRNVPAYERLLAAQAEGTKAETIYVDGTAARDVLMQSGVTVQELEKVLPGIKDQIDKAVETGGDIRIPTAQFGARLANTELGNALIPHMRLDPEAMSAADAQVFRAELDVLREEARTIMEEKEATDEKFVSEARQVEDRIFEAVKATGQYDDTVSRALAVLNRDFVVTAAAREGISPVEFDAKHPHLFVGPGVAAPLEQAAPQKYPALSKAWNKYNSGESYQTIGDLADTIDRLNDAGKRIPQTVLDALQDFRTAQREEKEIYGERGGTEDEAGNALEVAVQNAAEQLREIAPLNQAARLDAYYLAAVERGDMATAQRMVEEAAWLAGYTILVYHFTESEQEFTSFDIERGRAGPGIWLTSSPEGWFGRRMNLYLNPGKIENVKSQFDPTWREGELSIEGITAGDLETMSQQNINTLRNTEQYLSTFYVATRPEQVKSADPVVYDEAGNVVPLSRRFDITSPRIFEQAAMSTRVPTAVKPLEDALNDILLADYPTFLQDAKFVAKNLAKFKQLAAPIRIDETATEQQQLEQIIEHMSGNLLWLHDTMDANIRERAKMWYVGGRRLVDWLAERHGLSPMQAATVFAVLSPQKNWYENVGLGIRIIDIVATQGETKMDSDMQEAYLSSLRKEVTKRQSQLDKHDEKKPRRGKAEIAKWQEQRDEIAKALDTAASKVNEAQENIDDIGVRTLDEVLAAREFFLAAIMVRWFDQTKNDRTYPVISPEGGVGSPMVTEAGTPASIRYGSYNEVAKAIAAYVDGRAENVHLLIGGEHKVRNFYNNLFNPADPRFATIDTHAIAAAYLMPLAGTDALVAHGLGGGVGNAMFGLGGGYAVFYEAYRRAAEARGIDPREMQSITWEAIRGMFEAAMKGGLKAPVAEIWKRYVNGEIDIDTARAEVMQRAGGITTPSWVALPVDMQPNAGYSGISRTAADDQAKNIAAEPTAAAIMFEVAPDPANEELTAKWKGLSPLRRQEISVRVAETIVPRVLQEYGVAADMVLQIGGWKGDTNVGFALRMPPGPLVRQIARTIGEALSQEGMFAVSATEFKGSRRAGVIRLQLQPGLTSDQVGDLYRNTLYPLGIQGHATFDDSMVIALEQDVDAAILASTIADAVTGDSRVVGITQYEGWTSYDETRITTPTPSAEGKQRGAEGAAGRRRIDVYRLEAKRLVEQYLGESPVLEQAAAGPARGGFDPSRLTTIINKGSDASTLIHELMHYKIAVYTQIANQPNPPAEIAADLDRLLVFMGVAGDTQADRLAAWTGMSIDQRRPLEEKVAYNYEIYVSEGKAPSAELRGVFERMAAWMRRVYKSIRDDLNAIYRREFGTDLPILTDDVRAVFDRMLASEAQIRRQAEINAMKPHFQTQAESGMSDAEWAAYQEEVRAADAKSVEELTAATMQDAERTGRRISILRRKEESKWAGIRRGVRKEAEAEVQRQTVYRARSFLKDGTYMDDSGESIKADGPHRLDLEALKKMYANVTSIRGAELIRATGVGVPSVVRPDIDALVKARLAGKDGIDPDAAAELFGYSSGDEMVRAILDAKPIKEVIEARTDEIMLERHGDLNTPAQIDIAVQKALHNEIRARLVAIELRWVSKSQVPTRVMLEAARQAAEEMVAAKRIRDLNPSEHVAAEAKAARAAARMKRMPDVEAVSKAAYTRAYNEAIDAGATEADAIVRATEAIREARARVEKEVADIRARYGADPEQAIIRAKRSQLYQNQLAAEAIKAREEVDKGLKYLRKVLRDENVKKMGATAADQVRAILANFSLARMTRAEQARTAALREWLAAAEAEGLVPDIDPTLAEAARRKNYRDMTVEEFRELVDSVKQIEFMGKNEQSVRLAEERAAFAEKRDEVVGHVRKYGRLFRAKRDPRSPLTGIGRTVAGLRGFMASHLKAASVARILDGGEDVGPVWRYFIQTANAAGDLETKMRSEAAQRLSDILKPVFALGGMGGKGIMFPTIGMSLNRESRIAIALNMGNEGNRQRLLDGEGWTLEQLTPVLESLTKAEWDAVQAVWDFMDSYRPMIAAKERRLYGKEPKWVDPVAFKVRTADGQVVDLKGGYYPIKYDPVASERVGQQAEAELAKEQLKGAYTAATTRRSFTKARAKEVTGRPILYTLDAAFSGVNDVIHDLAWHEWLIQANRMLRDKEFSAAVRETRGPEFMAQLKEWVNDNAAGERGADGAAERALGFLRRGISASGLGFNVASAAIQITGFNQSIVRIGAKWVGKGIVQFSSSPLESSEFVNGKSSFMQERGRTQFREINEVRNTVRGESAARRRVMLGTYFLMMKMQRAVDIPTWLGAYEKGLAKGMDDATAVAFADQAVRDSQGSGLISDLSKVERGGPAMKLFTVFYSYMNTVYNMAAVSGMTARGKGKFASDMVMLFVVPVVLGHAIKAVLTPDADDEEFDPKALARKLAAEELSYMLGTMVVAREFGAASEALVGAEGVRTGYTGPAGLRAIGTAYQLATQAGQGDFDRAFRKAAINTLGAFTGLPSAQINRTIDGIESIMEGEVEGPEALMAPVFGVKR